MELTLTVAIMAVAMTMIYGVLHATIETSHHVEATLHDSEIGPSVLNMIRQDLESAILPYPEKEYFAGVNKDLGMIQTDRIDMVSSVLAYGKEVKDQPDERFTSINEVGYQLRENKNDAGFYILYRREDLFVDEQPLKGGRLTELYDRVKSLDITFYDGKEWVKEWNNVQNGKKLPDAIRVELILAFVSGPNHVTEKTYETTVVLTRQ